MNKIERNPREAWAGEAMRIQSVHIRNFRCLENVEVTFDAVTTFVGPNGAGKSTVLRSLEWFFNGDKGALTEDDVFSGATDDRTISVRVTFNELTDRDREALTTLYAPVGTEIFTATRTWSAGEEKTSGVGRTFPEFDILRAITNKTSRRTSYTQLAADRPDLGLPACRTGDDVDAALKVWESQNPAQLEESDAESTHFFGFNGQNVLSGIFDFVFVSADLRAGEESIEGRKTVLGRILERSLKREKATQALKELTEEVSRRQAEINAVHLGDQLTDLSTALTKEVEVFTAGRQIRLSSKNLELKPAVPVISLSIGDALNATSIDRQGHGFQRAVLIAALKLLAERGSGDTGDASVITLAIEEPELFQHPTQARVFASVLRALAEDRSAGMQVAYATHNPVFVSAPHFDQVRRVTREIENSNSHPCVTVRRASMQDVAEDITPHVSAAALIGRWHQVCTVSLAEAIFSDAVILVEGETDKAIIEGASCRVGQIPLARLGISIAVANGKDGIPIPHAILTRLGIPTLTVFDNDRGSSERVRAKAKSERKEQDAADELAKNIASHRKLLEYFNEAVVDFPEGAVNPILYAWADNLEEVLQAEWADWEISRATIVGQQRGAPKKNAATYQLAAQESRSEPGESLSTVITMARNLVG